MTHELINRIKVFLFLIVSSIAIFLTYLFIFPPLNLIADYNKSITLYILVLLLIGIIISLTVTFNEFSRIKRIILTTSISLTTLFIILVTIIIVFYEVSGNLDPEWSMGIMILTSYFFVFLISIIISIFVLFGIKYIFLKFSRILKIALVVILVIWIGYSFNYVKADFMKSTSGILSASFNYNYEGDTLVERDIKNIVNSNLPTEEKIKNIENYYFNECLRFQNESLKEQCQLRFGNTVKIIVEKLRNSNCYETKNQKCDAYFKDNDIWVQVPGQYYKVRPQCPYEDQDKNNYIKCTSEIKYAIPKITN